MVFFSEAFGEEEAAGKAPEDDSLETDVVDNGLGFLGGPAWHYPEEEVEFFPIDEKEVQHGVEENDASESCSGTSMDKFRIAMIEKFICTHDIHDDDRDFFGVCNANVDDSLSQIPPLDPTTARYRKIDYDGNYIDHCNAFDCNNSSNDHELPHTSPSALTKKRHTWISNSPITKRRRQREKSSGSCDSSTNNERQLHRFREAALCVPFEYTTNNATFYIRRPYGVLTIPDIFRELCPHLSNEEYKMQSRVSSSQTIQVGISVSADNSSMLLYGSAGVRYKTNPSDVNCDNWIDVPDVGGMDVPLGYVNHENHNAVNCNIEYSLDEILEEAMLVREQYCSTILSAVLEMEKHELLATANIQSPPSLVKSIVSTPPSPRSHYYYDGSSDNTGVEGEQEEIEVRKLDFLQCISPSLMTRESNETLTQSRHSSYYQRKRKGSRKRFYRFFQRVIIIVGFYCCGIFLVANLSVTGNHRSGTDFAEFLPSSYKTIFENNWMQWMLLNTDGEQEQKINGTCTNFDGFTKEDHSRIFQIAEIFAVATTNKSIKDDCRASIEIITDERDSYQQLLENSQKSLREQTKQNNFLFKMYKSERAKIEELQMEKDESVKSVKKLGQYAVILATDLEIEQEQRYKLEETIRELKIQIMTLEQEKSNMKRAIASSTLVKSIEMSYNEASLEALNTDGVLRTRKESEKEIIETTGFDAQMFEEQINAESRGKNQHQQSNVNEASETILVERLDTIKPLGRNRYFEEDNEVHEKEQLIVGDELLLTSSKNEIHSFENVLLKSARSDKGPLFPKVYRQIRKRFLPTYATSEARKRRRDISNSKNKSDDFASSVKEAIVHKIKNIVRGRQYIGNDNMKKLYRSRRNELGLKLDSDAKKEAELIFKDENSNTLLNIVHSISPNFVGNSMEIKDKFKSSTLKVLEQSKESSEMIHRQVRRNVDEVSTAGIRKLDRGQEVIKSVGKFAKAKLHNVGERVRGFSTKKWGQRKL